MQDSHSHANNVVGNNGNRNGNRNGAGHTRVRNPFWSRCHAKTFRIPFEAYRRVLEVKNSRLRASVYKLYRWMCSRVDHRFSNGVFFAQAHEIRKATRLSEQAIRSARAELTELSLILADRQGGPGGKYEYTALNPETVSCSPLIWHVESRPRYIRIPSITTLTTYADKMSGTDWLVYDTLCLQMGMSGTNEIPRKTRHWFKAVSENTLLAVERKLESSGFIKVKRDVIEILHPETSESMPLTVHDETYEGTYYADRETGQRTRFSEDQLTPELVEQYFRKSLPRPADWFPPHNAHCPFHHDQRPSLSINVETCKWYCHTCALGGHKLVTFEMRLRDTEDVQEAWKHVARKIGYTAAPRFHGKQTHHHDYRNAEGQIVYALRRYEDGGASFYHRSGFMGMWKKGLGGAKRTLYNLPEVITADTVILVEGEKKADILAPPDSYSRMARDIVDQNGKRVAVTCTGNCDSFRPHFVEYLVGKFVLIFPDSDEPGRRYLASVQGPLSKVGVQHVVIDFSQWGNDVRDFLDDYRTADLVNHVNETIGSSRLRYVAPLAEPWEGEELRWAQEIIP